MKAVYRCILVFLLLGSAGLQAQQQITANFKRYQQLGFQEKIYIHTDKSAYGVGETIWFRAYRVDALFHSPRFYSGLLYIDLYNYRDSLIRRLQVAPTDSCFQGSLRLPESLPQGKYTLVAYSNWMQNFDDAFYFRKGIFIHNPVELKVHTSADFREDGQGIPVSAEDFDLQFMPEGGHWLGGVMQRVAFKAVRGDGKGISLNGTVYDAEGQMVAVFGTSHCGIGSFVMQAKAGEKYTAMVKTVAGKEKKVALPSVEAEGITLQVQVGAEQLDCGVTATEGFVFPPELFLVVQCRGKVLMAVPVAGNRLLEIPLSRFPEGIVHCFLATAAGTVYSERLVFINRDGLPEVTVEGVQANYGPRDLVTLEMQFHVTDSLCDMAGLSVAVTDNQKTLRDTLGDNILSNLMLCSDIKGTVENPYYYFDTRIRREVRNRNADLLMLTQAWKRFDVAAVCKGEMPQLPHYLELRQSISGRVKNFWGKEATKGTLALAASGIRLYRLVDADEKGGFLVDNLSFPENTTFVIQGFSKKKSKFVEVDIDQPQFRPLSYSLCVPEIQLDGKGRDEDDFFKSLKMNYYYDKGVKVYVLDEAVVKARRSDAGDMIDELYKDVSGNRITGEELMSEGYSSVWDWLATVPGVTVDEAARRVSIRGGGSPELIVDDIKMNVEDLNMIPLSEIKSVGVVKNVADMVMLGSGGNGGIVIRLKDGASVFSMPKEDLGFFRFTPLGHHVPDQFYQPKYDTPEAKNDPVVDERITIYWNPDVRTDGQGKAKISFYTADVSTTYSVIVEGITKGGKPVFREYKLHRE